MTATTNGEIFALLRDVSLKLDNVVDRVAKLESAVSLDAALGVQIRATFTERIVSIETAISDDLKPQTESLKQMKLIGIGFLGLVGIGGMSIGGALVYAGDSMAAWLRHWLKLP